VCRPILKTGKDRQGVSANPKNWQKSSGCVVLKSEFKDRGLKQLWKFLKNFHKIGNKNSGLRENKRGVKRGDVISPFL